MPIVTNIDCYSALYCEINKLSDIGIININISDLKPKFGIGNISVKNHRLRIIYCSPKMHKTPLTHLRQQLQIRLIFTVYLISRQN